eukprot:TRINITY_DN1166_c0_g1_i5.p1 TRINITY_DN1166_c0_g1~~TRINITY_DN1166_c0_g1_i5.p1  ORF type:complete len:305 (+),score=56.49 TRINITY_DN1166_c0_g1_i5:531-1445(+)
MRRMLNRVVSPLVNFKSSEKKLSPSRTKKAFLHIDKSFSNYEPILEEPIKDPLIATQCSNQIARKQEEQWEKKGNTIAFLMGDLTNSSTVRKSGSYITRSVNGITSLSDYANSHKKQRSLISFNGSRLRQSHFKKADFLINVLKRNAQNSSRAKINITDMMNTKQQHTDVIDLKKSLSPISHIQLQCASLIKSVHKCHNNTIKDKTKCFLQSNWIKEQRAGKESPLYIKRCNRPGRIKKSLNERGSLIRHKRDRIGDVVEDNWVRDLRKEFNVENDNMTLVPVIKAADRIRLAVHDPCFQVSDE